MGRHPPLLHTLIFVHHSLKLVVGAGALHISLKFIGIFEVWWRLSGGGLHERFCLLLSEGCDRFKIGRLDSFHWVLFGLGKV